MNELENKVDVVDVPTVETTQETIPVVSQTETEAREQGWVPQTEWEGDPEKWRPAKEFVDRGELLRKLEHQGKELKQTNQALRSLADHHKKVRDVEYQRAITDLKQQRKAAFIEQDMERVAEIDEVIDYTKEQASSLPEIDIPEIKAQPIALQQWENSNSWYKNDRAMTAYTNSLAAELRQQGYSLEDALKQIDKDVRKEFPHKFKNTSAPKNSSVEGGGRTRAGEGATSFQLSDEERRVMRKFIQMGAIKDEKEYIEQLKAVR